MAHSSLLERRIAAMLNPHLDRGALSRRAAILASALLVLVAGGTATVRAFQAAPPALAGTVYDPTGAVIPGVALTLRDPNGGSGQATTDASGRFAFAGVGPGHYTLEATLMGFRSLKQEFDLTTPRDWDRAVTLQVGSLQETITVSAPRLPSAPPSSAPVRVRVGGNIRVPSKVLDVRPVYPTSMRQAGREADVQLDAIIGRDGSVASVRVLTGQIHPDFAIAAADAVREWRFTPTLLNGAPIEVVMTVTVSFKLSD
jgi:TonB family protein